MSKSLLPCPFCGGKAVKRVLRQRIEVGFITTIQIYCSAGGCTAKMHGHDDFGHTSNLGEQLFAVGSGPEVTDGGFCRLWNTRKEINNDQ